MIFALINDTTSIVENLVDWDGDTTGWSPPENYSALTIADKIAVRWVYDDVAQQWTSNEVVGAARQGDYWDGTKFIGPTPPAAVVP